MYVENDITKAEFGAALKEIEAMSPAERLVMQTDLRSSGARSYYVRTDSGDISMKLVIRLAYARAGRSWKQGDGLQSKDVFQRFKNWFPLVHEPKPRILDNSQLNRQETAERAYVSRLMRKGQAKFRRKLLEIDPVCVLTGCASINALEAAHIHPAASGGGYSVSNGLLLRADLHRLFDLGYMAINPKSGEVWLHKSCQGDYSSVVVGCVMPAAMLNNRAAAFRERWKGRVGK